MKGHAPKNLVEKHSCTGQMFITEITMKIRIARLLLLVIVLATVIDARVPKNSKAERKHRYSKSRTAVDAVNKSTPAKRDVIEDVTNEPNNNITGLNNNEPIVLTELLNMNLKALIGEDDADKLEFIKNVKEVLGVNSYENKDDAIESATNNIATKLEFIKNVKEVLGINSYEFKDDAIESATKLEFIKNVKEVLGVNSYENKDDAIESATKLEYIKNVKEVLGVNSYENKDDAIEALRGGDNAEYGIKDYKEIRTFKVDNLGTAGFVGNVLPNISPLLPAHFYQTAALRRGLLNPRRIYGFLVNRPQSYPRTFVRDDKEIQSKQPELQIPMQKIQPTIERKQSNVQEFQATQALQPLQPIPSLPLQRLKAETILMMDRQKIQQPVIDSNDNTYPYEPFIKR